MRRTKTVGGENAHSDFTYSVFQIQLSTVRVGSSCTTTNNIKPDISLRDRTKDYEKIRRNENPIHVGATTLNVIKLNLWSNLSYEYFIQYCLNKVFALHISSIVIIIRVIALSQSQVNKAQFVFFTRYNDVAQGVITINNKYDWLLEF